jgi:hypothetical protein
MEKFTNKGRGGQTRPVFKPKADGSRGNIGRVADPKGGANPSGPPNGQKPK